MRDPDLRRASKRAYYARHKSKLQGQARARYAEQRVYKLPKPVSLPRPRRKLGRDAERRNASKFAYYRRNRGILLEKARERMGRLNASRDPAALHARRLASMAYRNRNHERLNLKRLNLYRKHWILKNGVSQFLTRFRGRAQAGQGELLEHWDHKALESVIRTR